MEISQHRLHRLLENCGKISQRGRRPAYCYSCVIKVREGPDAGVRVSWCSCPSVAFLLTSLRLLQPLYHAGETEKEREEENILFLQAVNLQSYKNTVIFKCVCVCLSVWLSDFPETHMHTYTSPLRDRNTKASLIYTQGAATLSINLPNLFIKLLLGYFLKS